MNMSFRDYKARLKDQVNKPACLSVLTAPFGLRWRESSERYLMIGHILDALAEDFKEDDVIDSLDVATLAWELGCSEAGRFLDEAPNLLYQQINPLRTSSPLN